jgi:hypothetical protein
MNPGYKHAATLALGIRLRPDISGAAQLASIFSQKSCGVFNKASPMLDFFRGVHHQNP